MQMIGIELFADRANSVIHHVAWSDAVGAGLGIGKGAVCKGIDALVIHQVIH